MAMRDESVTAAFFQQSSFATHAVVPAHSLVRAPAGLPPELLAALPCGVQTGAGTVLNVMRLKAEDSLIVFGAGAVGLAAVMAAAASGVRDVVAVDVVDSRLQLARELGAALTVNARTEAVVATVRAHRPEGMRFALDTATLAATWAQAVECLAVGGMFAYVSVPKTGGTFGVEVRPLFERFVTLHPIHQGEAVPREFLPQLARLYESGRFPVDRLVTTYAFDQIDRAFEDAHRGTTVKPVLVMGPR
jgi:aryl-alcohol dehydrogenase